MQTFDTYVSLSAGCFFLSKHSFRNIQEITNLHHKSIKGRCDDANKSRENCATQFTLDLIQKKARYPENNHTFITQPYQFRLPLFRRMITGVIEYFLYNYAFHRLTAVSASLFIYNIMMSLLSHSTDITLYWISP